MLRNFIFLFFLLNGLLIQAQDKKILNIERTLKSPKIDGILDDEAWKDAETATGFTQFRPEMGVVEREHQQTIVKMAYNDNAIFVGAYLHDRPEDIMKQFTSRDNFGQSDFFGVVLNPNNDAQNDIEFFVFSSGTQADAVSSPSNGEDFGWNAVWDSAVRIVDDGWIVEMKIPYSALRFSNQEVQTWGLQLHRRFRVDNSQYSWNPIDRTKGNIGLYHGELRGIENITPPTRLSLYPFASTLIETYDGETSDEYSLGLDIKYGLSENFTLDATLIPDFNQAGFDNIVLNLGPFEQQYSEQRQFFKEGVDLFNKGNLFYSRRVGGSPSYYPDITDDEEVIDYPDKVKMLNAVKVSGRTKEGLGIGLFNAITEKTYATVRNNVTQETRKEVVEPFANYNILVLDQQFRGNSSISLINTNVIREGHFRDANVIGGLFDITNKANKYNFRGEAKISSLNEVDGTVNGFSSSASFGKVSGKYRYRVGHTLADDKYDINDLGIQFRNNFNNFWVNASYRIFEPTDKLNNFNISLWGNYNRLFNPSTYTGNSFGISIYAQNKKLTDFGGNINTELGKQYDYFEPRTEGRYFIFKNILNSNVWFSTDYGKTFALDGNVGFVTMFDPERELLFYWIGISPRVRFNEKFVMSYNVNINLGGGSRGFVADIDDDIVFGERDQNTIVNSISGNYNFNSFHGLTLTFRNYWTTVDYDHQLFTLLENGNLSTADNYTLDDVDDPNVNFNTWNLDFRYQWQFAPGSQLVALYRNELFNSDTASSDSYFESLNTLFKQPARHSFSLKLIYYLDYNNVKSILGKKRS
jgi:hypothetical protein